GHEGVASLRRRLVRRDAARARSGALRWEWVRHDTAPDRGDRRERAQHESVAAPRHERSVEHQARATRFARPDAPGLDDTSEDLRRAQVDANASARGERLRRPGEELDRGVEHARGAPARTRDDDGPAGQLAPVHAHEGQGGTASRYGPRRGLAVNLD